MSAVASSSLGVASRNPNNSVICNNSSKRRSGTFRVLTEEYSQFSLDDEFDNDFHQIFSLDGERYTLELNPVLDEPLINHCDNTSNEKRHHAHSRLTDEVEIDDDSASDELDLLPTLPPYSDSKQTFPKWKIKLPNWLLCRNPRIPVKCIIM